MTALISTAILIGIIIVLMHLETKELNRTMEGKRKRYAKLNDDKW